MGFFAILFLDPFGLKHLALDSILHIICSEYIMNTLGVIKTRRSIRAFKASCIPGKVIDEIIEAGRWAPSGLNNQPWRFMVLEEEKKNALASFTRYSYIIKGADKAILVFLDKKTSYNREKDLMAIGACVQNMLLHIHSIKLGACWLGEILNSRNKIKKLLGIPNHMELEAVIAIGEPRGRSKTSRRKELKKLLICAHS